MQVDSRLEKLSPNWYNRIKNTRTLDGLRLSRIVDIIDTKLVSHEQTLNISNYESCLVGEAYGFSKVYVPILEDKNFACKKCASISQRLPYATFHSAQNNALKYFQRVVRELCNHMERDHHISLK